jgi:hypothetical protein
MLMILENNCSVTVSTININSTLSYLELARLIENKKTKKDSLRLITIINLC